MCRSFGGVFLQVRVKMMLIPEQSGRNRGVVCVHVCVRACAFLCVSGLLVCVYDQWLSVYVLEEMDLVELSLVFLPDSENPAWVLGLTEFSNCTGVLFAVGGQKINQTEAATQVRKTLMQTSAFKLIDVWYLFNYFRKRLLGSHLLPLVNQKLNLHVVDPNITST